MATYVHRTRKHQLQHDFESFIYVMLFYGPDLPDLISAIFDAAVGNGNVVATERLS